jgi:hypothetical protein
MGATYSANRLMLGDEGSDLGALTSLALEGSRRPGCK